MKLKLLALSLCALVTAGCVHIIVVRSDVAGFDPAVVRRPEPRLPNVFVDRDNFLVVDQEPIRLFSTDVYGGRVTLSWRLDSTSRFTFPENAVTFRQPTGDVDKRYAPIVPKNVDCKVGEKAKVFTCSFDAPRGPWRTNYAVRVNDGTRALEALDPTIYGDM